MIRRSLQRPGFWPIFIILSASYFLILGGFLFLNQKGYLVQWHHFDPPTADYEIIGTTWGRVAIKTPSGQIYICRDHSDACTEISNLPEYAGICEDGKVYCDEVIEYVEIGLKVAAECQYDTPAFTSIFSPPPKPIYRECLFVTEKAADAVGYFYVIKDENNRLWFWNRVVGGFLYKYAYLMMYTTCLLLAFGFGFSTYSIWALLISVRKHSSDELSRTFLTLQTVLLWCHE